MLLEIYILRLETRIKSHYSQRCFKNSDCNTVFGFQCINGICACSLDHYFNGISCGRHIENTELFIIVFII